MVGDTDHYFSPYVHGTAQAMSRLGHLHSQVSIRSSIDVIVARVRDVRPHVLWTHMLLWAPQGAPAVDKLQAVVAEAARSGSRVIVHDGDYKEKTRHAHDISRWCALALCNHKFKRDAWRVPTLHWPYAAFSQDEICSPSPEWACDVWFAGRLSRDAVYGERTALVDSLIRGGTRVRVPADRDGNTLFQTAEIAASAGAVLGFGRPGVDGWVDTRVFQYPGAGGILLHDDAGGYLEPWTHFAPYTSRSAESIREALARLASLTPRERLEMRERAFRHVQERHSTVARVWQVLETLGLR